MGAYSYENTSGGGGPFEIFRGEEDVNGDPIHHEAKYSDYIVPAEGKYRLKLTGFAKPVDAPISEKFLKPGGPTHKKETKLELEITSDRGKGKRWICSFVTFSLGDSANLFRVYVATACGGDASKAPDLRQYDDMLGKEFEAYVNVSDKRDDRGKPIRAMLVWDTVKAVGAASDTYDPFGDEEDVA
jgi:hypothetical protein